MHQKVKSPNQSYTVYDYRASIQQPNSKPISPVFLIIKLQNLHETN